MPRPTSDARRCVLKVRLVRMNAYGRKAARLHFAYIERDCVEQDGSRGQLYGESEVADSSALANEQPGERHQFRLVVSPEDDIDLTPPTRDLMARLEDDVGVRPRWGAVNRHNTDNPHTHIVVRGADRSGRDVWIDRAYITERMHWQAQHLLGLRPEHVTERHLDRQVGEERLRSIDRRLVTVLRPDQRTDVAQFTAKTQVVDRRRLVDRLQKLEPLQLAMRTGRGAWQLSVEWKTALRELGERCDIIKRIHRAMGDDGDPARDEVVDASIERKPFEGVVRRKGLHYELRGDAYAVVETLRGKAAVWASTRPRPKHWEGAIERTAEPQKWAKPMDRVIDRVARDNGGLYDAKAHREALRHRPVVVAGRTDAPEEVVAANVRRLARLERYSLLTRIEDGWWRVPSDLVPWLESSDVSHPRRRVRAQSVTPALNRQITLRSLDWLDAQDAAQPRAFFGLGVVLGRAIHARARFLATLGIPAEPVEQRLQALERLESIRCVSKARQRAGHDGGARADGGHARTDARMR